MADRQPASTISDTEIEYKGTSEEAIRLIRSVLKRKQTNAIKKITVHCNDQGSKAELIAHRQSFPTLQEKFIGPNQQLVSRATENEFASYQKYLDTRVTACYSLMENTYSHG